ncbi:MAG: hypothetical protein M3Q06_08750 [Bacteroidota bacterium]|nr:hypothetical protein [Bacteroidota bacterium]
MRNIFISFLSWAFTAVGCVQIEEPEFREIRDFHTDSVTLDSIGIHFSMAYYNPNDVSVSVKESVVVVYLDSVYLGAFRQSKGIDVKKNEEFAVPLSGMIPLSLFLKMDVRNLLKRQVTIKAEGTTRIGKAGIYITKRINYQGRHRLNESMVQ